MKRYKPEILSVAAVAQSKLFRIEAVHLRFSNHREVVFERMASESPARNSVVMVPLVDDDTLLLVREYAVGVEDYVLRLPQGMINAGESATQAADRELMEEVGYGAKKLQRLGCLNLAPNWLPFSAEVILAKGLYPSSLPGDEPESLEVIRWPVADISKLIKSGAITEASSLAALFFAQMHICANRVHPN